MMACHNAYVIAPLRAAEPGGSGMLGVHSINETIEPAVASESTKSTSRLLLIRGRPLQSANCFSIRLINKAKLECMPARTDCCAGRNRTTSSAWLADKVINRQRSVAVTRGRASALMHFPRVYKSKKIIAGNPARVAKKLATAAASTSMFLAQARCLSPCVQYAIWLLLPNRN